jgi:hypothetical protein
MVGLFLELMRLHQSDCYCHLPLYIFCGRHLVVAKLRRANTADSAGAVEEVTRIVSQATSETRA